ncbi:glycosyltransferase family 29 protein [Streptomyces sp. TRM66268-LWL]|uniref:Glycosyltransferase family 29 protein n=1 Tax=Streptomyces polyasparticus TaxID=2767826 RepID=A0ABR7SS41_9ACTN|nr:glycosyltransferase family 29 protein [Streptomyces polyasparticus]MBC9717148.1 glycosyltransferase family 29 protein [Streptomyces polyasparticus]
MTRVLTKRVRARGGELDDCLRACAAHSGKLVATEDRRRIELAEQLRKLLVLWSTAPVAEPAPGATAKLKRAVRGATTPAAPLDNELLDALLAVADRALRCGYDDELGLAEIIADTVLEHRRNSRAGWRLRGRVLEAQGRPAEAVEAYERHLELVDEDGYGVRARVAGMRTATTARAGLLALLGRSVPGAERFTAEDATTVWADGLAAHDAGDREGGRARMVGALLAMDRAGAPDHEVQEALGHYLGLTTGSGAAPTPDHIEALALYADARRGRMRGPVPDPLFGGVQWLSLGEFRNRIAGKSVCLIANSGKVGESRMGDEIDGYDLVVRFNSYRIDPAHTGRRTDLHVTIHKHHYNWDKKVDTRLVFGGNSADWKWSVRNKLLPGAQTCVNDESLRWPVRGIGGASTAHFPGIPTSGFNMAWLLDFLDVSPTLDLIGFDFYESGAYRIAEAMKLAITNVHAYGSEKAWVMDRAQSVSGNGMRISLR